VVSIFLSRIKKLRSAKEATVTIIPALDQLT